MLRRWAGKVVCTTVALTFAVSCAAGGKMLSTTTANMAAALKDFCVSHGVSSLETRRADSLCVAADAKFRKGQKKEAYELYDRAVLYYRLALSKRELEQTERRLEQIREQVRLQEQQLSDYREVARGLKGGAQ